MTIRPSSLHRTSPIPRTLLDAISQPIRLGDELGRGGEGCVYEVDGDESLVVKVYHKSPLADEQVAKLRAMASVWTAELEKISAWPRTLVFDPADRRPCGLMMSKVTDARPLHELYGTTNRRRHFPDVGWHHLLLAARNVAAAFGTLHAAGIVVGDVNQGNLLVDPQMRVRMIDCDSFQISRDGKTYTCPVGSPHFTPPELQGIRLREVVRTPHHDRFGMATLIFHLLFVGRHPFAGRFRGQGDMPIEKAIAERRFAFSRNKAATMIDPPPASLVLDDLPREIGELFEAAFRCTDPNGETRPTPQQWVQQLESLIKRRRTCGIDEMHVYSAENPVCPWCRIEDIGGPSFFVPANVASTISSNRLARLDDKVRNLKPIEIAELRPERLALPALPRRLPRAQPGPKWTSLDVATALLLASWMGCFAAAVSSLPAFIASAALSLVCTLYLLFAKRSGERRERAYEFRCALAKRLQALAKQARTIERQHRVRLTTIRADNDELDVEKRHYYAEGDELANVILNSRHSQRDEYLRDHALCDHYQRIFGMTPSHVTLLESYGVESAYDLERIKLCAVPSIDSTIMIELLNWRAELERRFVFKPEHGVTLDNLKSLGGAAVQRFKMSQARKILMGDERLRTLAEAGNSALAQSLAAFDEEVRRWRRLAGEFSEFQQSRGLLERTINRSPASLFFPTLGVLALAALVHYLSR